jgi:L-seryl-tRNA(Ser) seleniumtransferase
MEDATKNARLRSLPSIDELLARPFVTQLLETHPRQRTLTALRRAVDGARARLLLGDERGFDEDDVRSALRELSTPNLRAVLNATGVVLHTNLGRAPLALAAAERVRAIAAGYSNLEYDLHEGERGSRYQPVAGLLRALTGAEDALVVNNNAAAVLLVLSALASGRDVIVSRGELVEIGGGFRVPDVMRQSGARLVEVGTTNRTRLADYEQAISDATALVVKVHKSNFAQVGFTEEVTTKELCELGRRRKVPVFEDLGSGQLVALAGEGLSSEPLVRSVVAAGADLVAFSGDKLLGGPQAGIVVGRAALLEKVARHPLTRAVRVDKMTVAALEATLELYRDGREQEVPAVRLLTQPAPVLKARAERLQGLLEQAQVASRVVQVSGQVGGGAMPLATPTSWACALPVAGPQAFADRLRLADPPVVARVADDCLLLDVRCLSEEELEPVTSAVRSATGVSPC